MTGHDILEAGLAFVFAQALGTFLEYAIHRLMHSGRFLTKHHAEHHQEGSGQGWYGEFKDYFLPTLTFIWIGFVYSIPAGIGFAIGDIAYTAFAAYSHQLQHERPELAFWLHRPVHHLHHKHKMWHHNFGISTAFWDRVFRTYRKVDWKPELPSLGTRIKGLFQIKWI